MSWLDRHGGMVPTRGRAAEAILARLEAAVAGR